MNLNIPISYVDKILKKHGHQYTCSNTIHSSIHLKKHRVENVSQLEFFQIIGNLMFSRSYTKSVTYTINRFNRYIRNQIVDIEIRTLEALGTLRYRLRSVYASVLEVLLMRSRIIMRSSDW